MGAPSDSHAAPRSGRFLTFLLGPWVYGLPIALVREILVDVTLMPSPPAPAWIAGRLLHSGWLVPVIDLRLLIGLEPLEAPLGGPVVLLQGSAEAHDQERAFLVDGITGVMHLDLANTSPPSFLGSGDGHAFVLGVVTCESEKILLLDVDRLLSASSSQPPHT